MELDDLKQTWKQTPVQKATNTNIMELIQHKSYGPVGALKREFRKQIMVMAILPVALFLTNMNDISKVLNSVMFWSYVAFCLGGCDRFCLLQLPDSRKNGRHGQDGAIEPGRANQYPADKIKMEDRWLTHCTSLLHSLDRNSALFPALPYVG
jgi:hypothetical protein